MEITCSIVLYHNPVEDLRKAVDSFLNYTQKGVLYLVDNSATDFFRYQFLSPRIEYIYNGKNIGYGAGHNIAIRKVVGRSQYHLVLNPDVEFNSDILRGLFSFMQNNRHVGLVMPKVLYRNGQLQHLCKRLPSPFDLFLRRFFPGPMKFIIKPFLEKYELRNRDHNAIMEVPNLSGCFMFIRNTVFTSIGLFDERYFMYMEDTDLCRRINRYYRTVYYPLECIVHGYSKASYKSFKLMKYHLNASFRYFNKWGWFKDGQRISINRAILNNSFRPKFPVLETSAPLFEDKITSSPV